MILIELVKPNSFKTLFMILMVSVFSNVYSQIDTSKTQRNITYKVRYLESEEYFKSFKNNSEIYFGEGIAQIVNGDIGEAINKAKIKARDNLARNIKVRVKSSVEFILSSKMKTGSSNLTEDIDESINIQTETYTDQLLTEVNQSDYKIDYPTRNNVTIIFYISKSLYKSTVDKDIEGKKRLIRNHIHNGTKKFNGKHFVDAIKDWLLANEFLNAFFHGLPIQDDIDGTGLPKEVNAYINDKITSFFSGVNLKEVSGKLHYDVKGQLNVVPSIYVEYEDDYGKGFPIEDLPMKIDFIEGEGELRKKVISNQNGQAKLNIKNVNSEFKEAVVRINIDASAFPGIENFSNLSLAYLDIDMKKMKTVALAVSFINGGTYSSPDQLKNALQSELLSRGLQVVKTKITKRNVSENDIEVVNRTNADYLIYVYIQSSTASKVGGYDNMYLSNSSGSLFIYQLPQGNIISSRELSSAKGYGVNASGAGWNGYAKIKEQVFTGIKSMAEELK